MEPFSFASSDTLDYPVSIRMCVHHHHHHHHHHVPPPTKPVAMRPKQALTPAASCASINLEGAEAPLKYSTLLEHPELRHIGSNQRYVGRPLPVWR